MRLASGFCLDPLGERSPRPPSRYKEEGGEGKKRVGNREKEGPDGREGSRGWSQSAPNKSKMADGRHFEKNR